ncbi:MAG: ROK family transcriptional regulator [Desulfovibrionales bacterium]|nr:ROK family transcriptional regulator [Desulfovibrionales bacterium]
MKNITISDIKKNNLSQIYNLIYANEEISKQEIAQALSLSLPTVTTKLNQLEDKGLIIKDGVIASNVGRKAVAYKICADAKVSVGISIYKSKVDIVIIDLKGNVLSLITHQIDFEKSDIYYKEIAYCIKDFILEADYKNEQILGIAFCFQGTTSIDRENIIYGKIIDSTGLSIKSFSQYLNFPCLFFHDAKSAANAEIWARDKIADALYMSISDYLGGAIIANSKVILGDNGHCGAIEHVQMFPEGSRCYCGQVGCVGTKCSISSLLNSGEDIDNFFYQVRNNEGEEKERWTNFLRDLSFVCYNFHRLLDRKIILGGKLAPYLKPEDVDVMNNMATSNYVFESKENFILLSKYQGNRFVVGAALYYVQKYLKKI